MLSTTTTATKSPFSFLHCGGEKELKFIEHFKKVRSTCPVATSYETRWTTYRAGQNRQAIMLLNAKRFKQDTCKVVILISREFIELMWRTAEKNEFVKIITSFKQPCLHIWLDVDENYVRSKSAALICRQNNFRRIDVDDLGMDGSSLYNHEFLENIYKNLQFNTSNSRNNYSVDDGEMEQMKKAYHQHYSVPTIKQKTVRKTIQNKNGRTKTKQLDANEIFRLLNALKLKEIEPVQLTPSVLSNGIGI